MGSCFGNITRPRLLVLKGGLFMVAGVLSSAGLLLNACSDRMWAAAALHGLSIWCFCRAYYFAFYVLERYVDPGRRYSGLLAAARDVRDILRLGRRPYDPT